MEAWLVPVVVTAVALVASTIAAIAGFGGAVVLLPVLVWAFGVREAVPILTVVQVIGNLARVWFNRREIVLPVVGWFAVGAVPLAVLGSVLFATAPADWLRRLLGLFLLGTVLYRHTTWGRVARIGRQGFLPLGAVSGLLSALVGSVGPLAAPFFLAHGLVKGAYIGTEALTAALMHTVKLAVYGGYALISAGALATGAAIGVVMILGSYLGKRLLDRVPERLFPAIVEVMLLLSGLQFLLFG